MNSRRGRPPKFVTDANGRPTVGLSFNKGNKNYYATFSDPRVYFGCDFANALFQFHRYQNQQTPEQPHIEIELPSAPGSTEPQIVTWSEVCGDPPVIAAAYAGESTLLPEDLFLETVRKFILKDTINAARKLGIPELARMTDLPPLERPLPLDAVLQFYLEDRSPSKDEQKKMGTAWREFCQATKVKFIRDITSDMIHDYRDITLAEYRKNSWANSWLKARFPKVKTLLRYYYKHGRTNKAELRTVLEFCKCLCVPSCVEESACPIEREHVHRLLDHCSKKWQAIVLLALNCGYYAKDIHDIKLSMIKQQNDLDYIVFPREKNKHMRVNVLWKDTREALDRYLSQRQSNSEHVFLSQFETAFDPHDVQRCFDRLRKKASLPDEVKFSHFRDGAASALFGRVDSDLLKVTIGHRIKGEKSKYISVKPKQVQICSDIIYEEYFG